MRHKQIAAEELNVPYEAITAVVMGDTDRTPDGGFSAGFLTYGGANIRKAAAFDHQRPGHGGRGEHQQRVG